jgi:hypothetical protein
MLKIEQVPVDSMHPDGIKITDAAGELRPFLSFHTFEAIEPEKVKAAQINAPVEFEGQIFPNGVFLYRRDDGTLKAETIQAFRAKYYNER